MKHSWAILTLALFLASCSHYGDRKDDADAALSGLHNEEQQHMQAYAKATGDALDEIAPDKQSEASALAKEFNDRLQAIVGLPPVSKQIDVAGLLSENAKLRKLATDAKEKLYKLDDATQRRIDKIENDKKDAERELIKMGKLYEEERNKSIVKRFWAWAVGSFGIAGAIAFIVLCPTIALPILGTLLSWLVKAIPSLVHFVGVVGKTAFEGVFEGVASFKNAVKSDPKKTYTPDEVLALLNSKLKERTDYSDKQVISAVEQNYTKDELDKLV